jgi:hypothetical protein
MAHCVRPIRNITDARIPLANRELTIRVGHTWARACTSPATVDIH